MKFLLILAFAILFGAGLNAQITTEIVSGQISFIGSQNIYVKFPSTAGIMQGDTLYRTSNGEGIPILVVNNLSSTSCVCKPLANLEVSVADPVIARIIKEKKKETPAETKEITVIPQDTILETKKSQKLQKIRGSISAISYSDFSASSVNNSQRFRYTLSLNAKNIGNSKISAETYISFRHKLGDWDLVKDNVFNALKIYNLSVKYDLDKTSWISIGRKINPKISSIGAMDGSQFEKTFNKVAIGALVGSRPDYKNYGIDLSLFQYGAYLAFNTKKDKKYTETSLAFMQQTNNGNTDRRFLYFQHSNSLLKRIYFFGTFEADLFKLKEDKAQNTFDPTGIYLLLRYNMTRKISFSGSYDARKNVVYYESYKNTIDTLFEKELRQGFRLQANYRITNSINFGVQSGYRFLKSDPNPSKNIYGYVNYSQIPWMNISATLSATYLESAYLNGKIFGGNISKDFLDSKLQTSIGYRYIDYSLPENFLNIIQHTAEASINWQFYKSLSVSLNYEGTIEKSERYNRLYLQLRKRF